MQCDGLRFLPPEAFALNIEYCSIVKDPVHGTQQGVVLIEVGSPMRGGLVAGEHDVEVAVDFLKGGISTDDIVIYKTSPNYDSFVSVSSSYLLITKRAGCDCPLLSLYT